jgi:hypothetical protein
MAAPPRDSHDSRHESPIFQKPTKVLAIPWGRSGLWRVCAESEALRAAAAIDPAIEWVGNMSRLGLVEILRRRRGPTLAEMWATDAGGRDA